MNKKSQDDLQGPEHKDKTDPQPESTHGGNMSDYGGRENTRPSDHEQKPQQELDPGAEKALRDQQPDPDALNREITRTDGLLGGKQEQESAYQNSQGDKLPPADEADTNSADSNGIRKDKSGQK
jgi:hypothetical protein